MKPLALYHLGEIPFFYKENCFISVMLSVSAAMLSAVSLTLIDGSIIERNVTGIEEDMAEFLTA